MHGDGNFIAGVVDDVVLKGRDQLARFSDSSEHRFFLSKVEDARFRIKVGFAAEVHHANAAMAHAFHTPSAGVIVQRGTLAWAPHHHHDGIGTTGMLVQEASGIAFRALREELWRKDLFTARKSVREGFHDLPTACRVVAGSDGGIEARNELFDVPDRGTGFGLGHEGRVYHGPPMPGSRPHSRGRRLPAQPSIAVVGASGLVGGCIVSGLKSSGFPAQEIRSTGVRSLVIDSLADFDLVFLAAPDAVSKEVAPRLAELGCIVIDLSAAFRLDPEVPLALDGIVCPQLEDHPGIVAGPNCTNVGLVRVLDILLQELSVQDLVVTTLQAASGGGRRMREALEGGAWEETHALAGNVVPQCDAFLEDGSTAEEQRLVLETQRLLEAPELAMAVTCVRVPVDVGHALSLHVRCASPVDLAAVSKRLESVEDLHVCHGEDYPTPASISGQDGVFVGRIRHGAEPNTLQMWIVIDNLLTGAASNAIAVARRLLPEA